MGTLYGVALGLDKDENREVSVKIYELKNGGNLDG